MLVFTFQGRSMQLTLAQLTCHLELCDTLSELPLLGYVKIKFQNCIQPLSSDSCSSGLLMPC